MSNETKTDKQKIPPPKLTRVRRIDSVPRENVEYTPEGFLIDTPIVTSVGIFEYNDPNGGVHRELRLPEHVFSEASLATYEGKPIIITHDAGRVSPENVTEEIVGTMLTKGYKDGDDVRVKIVIHDINEVRRTGTRELSLGYDCVLDETPGEWNGQPYDAIQTDIVINHLAIVREARAGEQARLNIDGKQTNLRKGVNAMAEKTKTQKAMNSDEMRKKVKAFEERRKRRLDEAEAAEAEEAKAEAAEKNSDEESKVAEEIKRNSDNPEAESPSVEERIALIKDRRDRRDAEGEPDDSEAAKAIIADQDEDIGQLVEIIEELQAATDIANSDSDAPNESMTEDEGGDDEDKPMNADSVDALVTERLRLGRIGDKLNLDGLETLRPIEAKKRVIKAVKPDLRLDGKSSHYINTAFDIAVQELGSRKDTKYQRKQMFNADGRGNPERTGASKAEKARENMLNRMKNGGK